MHERNLVKQAWLEAELYGSDDSKLAAFLQHFEGAKLHWHVIRAADPECDEDVVIFQKLVQRSSSRKDDTELQALMRVAERRGLLRSRKNSTDQPVQEDLVSA